MLRTVDNEHQSNLGTEVLTVCQSSGLPLHPGVVGRWTVVKPKAAQAGGISRRSTMLGIATSAVAASLAQSAAAQGQPSESPLASWNEGPAKQAILDFVRTTTDHSSKD